jgi:hypothetical protein
MRKLFFMAASVAFGDYCYSNDNIDIRVALQGDRIDVTASAHASWVGIGVPKSANFTEMPRGNFVLSDGSQLYQYALEMDYNWKPDKVFKSVVEGTGKANTVSNLTKMSFTRLLNGSDLIPIDPGQQFNLLWACGGLKPGETDYAAINYHQTSRGHVRVDLVNGNCASLAQIGKNGKKGKLGKAVVVCPEGLVACTTNLQRWGRNCILGACVAAQPFGGTQPALPAQPLGAQRVAVDTAPSCPTVLCAANTRCINGICLPVSAGHKLNGSP